MNIKQKTFYIGQKFCLICMPRNGKRCALMCATGRLRSACKSAQPGPYVASPEDWLFIDKKKTKN